MRRLRPCIHSVIAVGLAYAKRQPIKAYEIAGSALDPAAQVRHAARAAFREGTADVLKLIDAERVHAEVQRAAIDLRLDALLTTIEARFALGEETIP